VGINGQAAFNKTTTYQDEDALIMEEHRIAFGQMLRNWRLCQGWTQYTCCEWAEAAGFETISYGNLSVIEQGKAGELRQKAFFQLEEVNRRIAQQDFGPVKSQKLLALLEQAQPLGDKHTPVWGAVDFWCCYVGRKDVPPGLKGPPPEEKGLRSRLILRKRLIDNDWVTESQADKLIALIELDYAPIQRRRTKT